MPASSALPRSGIAAAAVRSPAAWAWLAAGIFAQAGPARIEIVDDDNGWPVPLVELRTNSGLRFVSDNAGVIALDAPELFGREVFFHVQGHGYGVPKDGFGHRGLRLTPEAGSVHRVEVERSSLAKRLGRLTGSGLFTESARFDEEMAHPESGVVGCDSIQLAEYRGRLFHLWGDTTLFHYPLGIFDSTAATTPTRPFANLEPPLRPDFRLFRDRDTGRPRGVAPIPGDGPTWLGGMIAVTDRTGAERLVATYAKIRPPLEAYEVGLCVWNDDLAEFERHRVVWEKSDGPKPRHPHGHPVRWTDESGTAWLLFGDPFPSLKCRDSFEAWENPGAWKVVDVAEFPKAAEDGTPTEPHRGSIAWSEWRGKWVCVFTRKFGDRSAFGEIRFTESPSPFGPWSPSIPILEHDHYTFYNPRIDRELTPADADFLVFEGTFTRTFSKTSEATPRHDYNQILYRLDFADLPGPPEP
jgi:hypothetical protein